MPDLADPAVRYSLTVSEPESHLAHLEMRIQTAELGPSVDVTMAAWCPGSYLVRDYARFVRDVRAEAADGTGLPISKVDKQTWRVTRGDAAEVVVRYAVYGHDLSVRTNHIDHSHAFFHGPATFLYVEALRDGPCDVTVVCPDGGEWPVTTALKADGGAYRAADIDELLDSPFHLGPVAVRSFEAAGAPIHLAVWGTPDSHKVADLDQLGADVEAIVEAHAERFGGVPFDDYTFLLMLSPGSYGGLEHKASSANLHTPFAMGTRKDYEGLLELLSHEFFHVWNGKRIYPAAFDRFRYEAESYTQCLWVVEGLTSYYDRYTLRACDKLSAKRYAEKLAEEWGRLVSIPGRHRHSLEESSYDAWIKLYKPDASNVNTTVSYYLKGGLVAMTLDLYIRRVSNGDKSLADVLRHLWREHGETASGYPEDVQAVFEAAVDLPLGEFFDTYVRGHADPDIAGELAHLGLALRGASDKDKDKDKDGESKDGDNGAPSVWLGVNLGRSARVTTVLDDSPAWTAGIDPADELIAIDGYRVGSEGDVKKRLATRASGDVLEIALFRRKQLRTVSVTLAESPPQKYEVVAVDEPTDEQKARFRDWMGEDLVAGKTLGAAPIGRWI
jgi:predicted metalloprotease with PDZ domain